MAGIPAGYFKKNFFFNVQTSLSETGRQHCGHGNGKTNFNNFSVTQRMSKMSDGVEAGKSGSFGERWR